MSSQKDIASQNIKQQIISHYSFQKTAETYEQEPIYTSQSNGKNLTLVTLNRESVTAQNLGEDFSDLDLVIFISRHSSQSGRPTLSVHVPGNFGSAELGGLPGKISIAPAGAMQTALKVLMQCKEELNLDYEVSYECTHHGPSLDIPTMFVELGSSSVQWGDLNAAQAVAHAVMASIPDFGFSSSPVAIGIGGTHYNHKFTVMALMGEVAFGHMIPKHVIPSIDADMLAQGVAKTMEKVRYAVLDWKGIKSEDKPNVLSLLEKIGLPYKKV